NLVRVEETVMVPKAANDLRSVLIKTEATIEISQVTEVKTAQNQINNLVKPFLKPKSKCQFLT
ncbi:MAG: hypothetical protein ACJAVP_000332, partial [Spirosomataceae bacterium]